MSEDSDRRFEQSELGRRLDQVVTLGRVSEMNLAQCCARVALNEADGEDGLVTDWLPWLEVRHGEIRSRFAPSVGERVVVIAPSGELGAAFILGGLPCNDAPPPWTTSRAGFDFGAGASWTHDPASQATVLALPASGSLTFKVGDSTSLTIEDGVIKLNADSVVLGDGSDLRPVARKGDTVAGGVITGGSTGVKAS